MFGKGGLFNKLGNWLDEPSVFCLILFLPGSNGLRLPIGGRGDIR